MKVRALYLKGEHTGRQLWEMRELITWRSQVWDVHNYESSALPQIQWATKKDVTDTKLTTLNSPREIILNKRMLGLCSCSTAPCCESNSVTVLYFVLKCFLAVTNKLTPWWGNVEFSIWPMWSGGAEYQTFLQTVGDEGGEVQVTWPFLFFV